jgi:hypothetical protein
MIVTRSLAFLIVGLSMLAGCTAPDWPRQNADAYNSGYMTGVSGAPFASAPAGSIIPTSTGIVTGAVNFNSGANKLFVTVANDTTQTYSFETVDPNKKINTCQVDTTGKKNDLSSDIRRAIRVCRRIWRLGLEL